MDPMLKQYRGERGDWGIMTHSEEVFSVLIFESGLAIGFFSESIICIFLGILHVEQQDQISNSSSSPCR